jgi:hypothetical protein
MNSTNTNTANGAKRTPKDQNRAREKSRKRDQMVKTYLSADEHAQLMALRTGTKLSYSELIRRLIMGKQFVIRDSEILTAELRRQGGLLKHTASEIFSEHMDLGRELSAYGRELLRIAGEVEKETKYD